jgi:hypothetical protein
MFAAEGQSHERTALASRVLPSLSLERERERERESGETSLCWISWLDWAVIAPVLQIIVTTYDRGRVVLR